MGAPAYRLLADYLRLISAIAASAMAEGLNVSPFLQQVAFYFLHC